MNDIIRRKRKPNQSSATSGSTGLLNWEVQKDEKMMSLKITGIGAMPDYKNKVPWGKFREEINNVIIEEGCTNIGDFAFMNMSNLFDVRIPNTVRRIGYSAFLQALSLNTINIPASVKIIEESAFEDVQALEKVTFSDGLEQIGEFAFANCSNIENLTFPASLTRIARGAFEGCSSINKIILPNSIKKIEDSAFSNCTSLVELTLNEGLEEIGKEAFMGNKVLKTLKIPKNVKKIGEGAFSDCTEMDIIIVAIENTNFESEAAVLYNKGKTRLITYASGKAEKNFFVPDSVRKIDDFAFCGVESLTSVTFGEHLEELGAHAFTRCDKIAQVSLPASIKSIGNAPFHDCASLTYISIPTSNAKYATEDGILYNKEKTHLVQYPVAKENEDYVAPSSLQQIGAYAFFQNTNLQTVDLPHTLKYVGLFAFGFCRKLKRIICSVAEPVNIKVETHAFFTGGEEAERTLYVPRDCATKYEEIEEWSYSFGKNIKELLESLD